MLDIEQRGTKEKGEGDLVAGNLERKIERKERSEASEYLCEQQLLLIA